MTTIPLENTGDSARRRPRVAFFNDTGSEPHAGCLAVSDAHDRMLRCSGIDVSHRHYVHEFREWALLSRAPALRACMDSFVREEIALADAVVVNGEGSIHGAVGEGDAHSTLHGAQLLTILETAKELGKPAVLVNATIDRGDAGWDDRLNVLSAIDDVVVRDLASSRLLESRGIAHRVVPDSILAADFAGGAEPIFTGKVVITDSHASRTRAVSPAIARLRESLGESAVYLPLEDGARRKDWRWLVAQLSHARCVVSARHHGVYLGLMAGVPLVALASSTHKSAGTLELIAPWMRTSDDNADLVARVSLAEQERDRFARASTELLASLPLATFEGLRTGLGMRSASSRTTDSSAPRTPIDPREVAFAAIKVFGVSRCTVVVCGVEAAGRTGHGPERLTSVLREAGCPTETLTQDAFIASRPSGTIKAPEIILAWDAHRMGYPSAFFDACGLRPGAGVVCIAADDGQRGAAWWIERAEAAGLTLHPRVATITDPAALLSRGGWWTIPFNVPFGASPGSHTKKLSTPARLSTMQCAGWAAKFVRPHDRVLVSVGATTSAWAEAIRASAFAESVEQSTAQLDALRSDGDGIGTLIVDLSRTGAGVSPVREFVDAAAKLLTPAGRMILLLPTMNASALAVVAGTLRALDARRAMLVESGAIVRDGSRVGTACSLEEVTLDWSARPVRAQGSFTEDHGPGVLVLMRDPTGAAEFAGAERALGTMPDSASFFLTRFIGNYDNPWLVPAMVSIGLRAHSTSALVQLAERTLGVARKGSADRGAALCVLAYAALDRASGTLSVSEIEAQLRDYCGQERQTPASAGAAAHAHRWTISCWYVLGRILQARGESAAAHAAYEACAGLDPHLFSPLLATKTIDALARKGIIELQNGTIAAAEVSWKKGVAEARRAAGADWLNVCGSMETPLPFGVRELAEVLDAGTRCAGLLASLGTRNIAPGLAWERARGEGFSHLRGWIGDVQRANAWLVARLRDEEAFSAATRVHTGALAHERNSARARCELSLREVEQLRSWLSQVESARSYHEAQSLAWQESAGRASREHDALREWTVQLQEGQDWHRQQSENWKSASDRAHATAAELGVRIAQADALTVEARGHADVLRAELVRANDALAAAREAAALRAMQLDELGRAHAQACEQRDRASAEGAALSSELAGVRATSVWRIAARRLRARVRGWSAGDEGR